MIYILPKWERPRYKGIEIDTTSSSGSYRELSPFILGPIETYIGGVFSENFENLWQFSKVYAEHLKDGQITLAWCTWRAAGWADKKAHRYPMGKGMKPEFSLWGGKRLGYIDARKQVYARYYAMYVSRTASFRKLLQVYQDGQDIILKDYDAYDHRRLGMTLVDVINAPNRKMGHAFVLAMILEDILEECLK